MPVQIWPRLVNFLFAKPLARNTLGCSATGGNTVYQKRSPTTPAAGWPKPTEVSKESTGLHFSFLNLNAKGKSWGLRSWLMGISGCARAILTAGTSKANPEIFQPGPCKQPRLAGNNIPFSPLAGLSEIMWYGIKTTILYCSILLWTLQGRHGKNQS